MPFVKLDSGILESTLWIDRALRDVFITALLMAEPYEARTPLQTYEIGSLKQSGFVVPAGWYGFVAAADSGIIRRALVEYSEGMDALKRLGEADGSSRSAEFEGRRMVRVDGGFVILNYAKYREKDYTGAERQARWRERNKGRNGSNGVIVTPVTQAEAEVYTEAEVLSPPTPSFKKRGKIGRTIPEDFQVTEAHRAWAKEKGCASPDFQIERFVNHYQANGKTMKDWDAAFRNWLTSPYQQHTGGGNGNGNGHKPKGSVAVLRELFAPGGKLAGHTTGDYRKQS